MEPQGPFRGVGLNGCVHRRRFWWEWPRRTLRISTAEPQYLGGLTLAGDGPLSYTRDDGTVNVPRCRDRQPTGHGAYDGAGGLTKMQAVSDWRGSPDVA